MTSADCATFLELLRSKSERLFAAYDQVVMRGTNGWLPLLGFVAGSHQGLPHLRGVERNADRLVPAAVKEQLSAGELFVLLCSIFLHDIGRVLSGDHAQASAKLITDHWSQLGLPDERIAVHCAQVARCHTLSRPEALPVARKIVSLEPYGPIRLRLMAAILRLADETNDQWTRALEELLYSYVRKSGSPAEGLKDFRTWIDDVEFCHAGQCIILHVSSIHGHCDSLKARKLRIDRLNDMRHTLQAVLGDWQQELKPAGIDLRQVLFEVNNAYCSRIVVAHATSAGGLTLTALFDHLDPARPTVAELLDGLVSLSLGSLGHKTFSLSALEAQVGHRLQQRELWLLGQMNLATSLLSIGFQHDGAIRIEFNRDDLDKIRADLGVQTECC